MPAARAAAHEHTARASDTAIPTTGEAAQTAEGAEYKTVRLHITPFTPALLKVYLAPSVLPHAQNVSYHTVETFPEKGFGYVELPAMEAQKLKKKLNGSTLKGSKVRIEDAKPEKRKAGEDAEAAKESEERPAKRPRKEKKLKEQGVLEGAEMPADRKVKRGWTDPPAKGKEKKDKKGRDKDKKSKKKESKYTKEPEMLFKAKLTPVAAAEVARKEKHKEVKEKKDKKKSKSKREVVLHEFEKNTKQPNFLKESKVSTEKKPAVEYVNGKGWVDEDGNVVEAETGKARNRRVLELVDPVQPTTEKQLSATPSPRSSPAPKSSKKEKPRVKKITPPPSSSESEEDESSEVSSSSEEESSELEAEAEEGAERSISPTQAANSEAPGFALTPSSPANKEVHPLEALFKRPKPSSIAIPGSNLTSTPAKGLAPINTSFSFFDNSESMEVDADASENPPVTPYTQRDLEWRGLRSAAPTPDTAAIGRRFSFPWRNNSQEADEENEEEDPEAEKQLTNNTKANASTQLPGVAEEDEEEEEDAEAGAEERGTEEAEQGEDGEEKPESEFRKWFWENQGSLNRAWKKRRRDALKTKRLTENRRAVGGRRAV